MLDNMTETQSTNTKQMPDCSAGPQSLLSTCFWEAILGFICPQRLCMSPRAFPVKTHAALLWALNSSVYAFLFCPGDRGLRSLSYCYEEGNAPQAGKKGEQTVPF